MIPRLSTTNEDVEFFAVPLSDGYEEIIDLFASALENWRWPERERVFWETVIARERYEIRMATPAHAAELAYQQVEATWPTAILEPVGDDHLTLFGPDTDAWQLRLRFPHFLSLSTDRRKLAPLPQLLELSRQFRGDDYAVVQLGFQAAESDWWKDAQSDRREFDRGHKPGAGERLDISQRQPSRNWQAKDLILRFEYSSALPIRAGGNDLVAACVQLWEA
ncbi:hypothetical protein D478_26314 [Brevibacillus agri BAB-2500]|nr:hypothetical protein D478_26314 [Brevibacillus agri BAB-2500]